MTREVHTPGGCAVAEREGGLLLSEVIAAVVGHLRVEHLASLFEQGGDALGRAAGDVSHLLRGRLGQLVELDRAVVELDVDAVDNERMEVHIEAERGVEALADGDAAGVRLAHAIETERLLRAVAQGPLHLVRECSQHLRAEQLVVTEQSAQPPRQ